MSEIPDRYGIVNMPSNRLGEPSTRTYDLPPNPALSQSSSSSWLVLELGDRVGELSFEGDGGADLAEEIGRALIKGAAELRDRIKVRGPE